VTHAVTSVRFAETASPRWRVVVYNHDDAPIADLKATLYAVPRRLVFRAEPGRTYRLLFGNTRASTPVYDMARLTDTVELDAASPASIGVTAANPAYRDQAPWSERHPWVLWVALGLAVVVLGGLAVRTLRGSA